MYDTPILIHDGNIRQSRVVLWVGSLPTAAGLIPPDCRCEIVADRRQALHAMRCRHYDVVLMQPDKLLERMNGLRRQAA
jgi:hypothetical protein